MNRYHRWLCRSEGWRTTLRQRVPWVVGDTDLGPNPLEIGPGPGLTTDLLRIQVRSLTALEIDPVAARDLRSRLTHTNVSVVDGDATAMPFSDGEFSAAVAFTMLHHIPSTDLQDRLLREVRRVIKPGGLFLGSDSLQGVAMRLIHLGDTLVPVDPETFAVRLEAAGFQVLLIDRDSDAFRFRACLPATATAQTP